MKLLTLNIFLLAVGFVGVPMCIERFSRMKPSTLNLQFLIAGLIGMPICLFGWQRSHQHLWLLGVGLFAYFLVSSVREILLKSRRQ
jgi:uncharacterized membrane protein YoaK (UPF0700 family)